MQRSPTRRTVLHALAASTATATVAGCIGGDDNAAENDNGNGNGTPDPVTFEASFEDGLDTWEQHSHIGPDASGEFEHSIEQTDERAYDGEHSVAIFTEGTYDDGTAWIDHPIEIESGHAYEAEASVYAWSPSESFNVVRQLVAYLGPEQPTEEFDFPQSGENSSDWGESDNGGLREPLQRAEGWEEYSFTWETPTLDVEELYFAVGVTVVWEADRIFWIDDVSVSLEPQ